MLDNFNPFTLSNDIIKAHKTVYSNGGDLYEELCKIDPAYSEIDDKVIFLAGGMFILGNLDNNDSEAKEEK